MKEQLTALDAVVKGMKQELVELKQEIQQTRLDCLSKLDKIEQLLKPLASPPQQQQQAQAVSESKALTKSIVSVKKTSRHIDPDWDDAAACSQESTDAGNLLGGTDLSEFVRAIDR